MAHTFPRFELELVDVVGDRQESVMHPMAMGLSEISAEERLPPSSPQFHELPI
jgi:hypothetical protein